MDWKTYKLGELGKFKNGVNFNKDDFGKDIPLINVKNLFRGRYATINDLDYLNQSSIPRISDYALEKGDILFARSSVKASGAGQVAMVNELPSTVSVFSGFIIRFRITEDDLLDCDYLNYLLRSPDYRSHFQRIGTGTTITNLSQAILSNVEISIPDIAEQRVIAKILSALDNKIELNQQMNATLDGVTKALYKAWFIDFEPVWANTENRLSVSASPETTKLFPSSFENGIPKGWERKKINQIASKIQYGFTQSSTTEAEGLPKFLRITDIQGGKVDWRKVPYCVVSDAEFQKYRIKEHDIFIARTGASTGENIYISEAPKAVFASYLIRVQFDKPILAFYFGKFFRSSDYFDYVASIISGSAQPNANAQELTNIEVLVPSEEVLTKYFESVYNFEKQKSVNNMETEKLEKIRDSLLPRLISGKLPVSKVESQAQGENGCDD